MSRGLGRHVWAAPAGALRAWAVGLFAAELSYFFTLMCVKWSILAFYWRSFGVRNSIKGPILALALVVLGWGIAVVRPPEHLPPPLSPRWLPRGPLAGPLAPPPSPPPPSPRRPR